MPQLPPLVEEQLRQPALGFWAPELPRERSGRTTLPLSLTPREVIRRAIERPVTDPAPRLDLDASPRVGPLAHEVELAMERAHALPHAAPSPLLQLPARDALRVPTEVEL